MRGPRLYNWLAFPPQVADSLSIGMKPICSLPVDLVGPVSGGTKMTGNRHLDRQVRYPVSVPAKGLDDN